MRVTGWSPKGFRRCAPVPGSTRNHSLRKRQAGDVMSKFFINRPIVAIVISIVLVLVGSLTILNLPIAQFPNIAPPEIQIVATYVGADAQTLEQAVATPLEQQMNGVDN